MKELPIEELSKIQEKRQKLPNPEHIKKQILNESLRDSARSETIENSNGTIYSSFEEEESFQKKSSK